jgi:hypothetical protein
VTNRQAIFCSLNFLSDAFGFTDLRARATLGYQAICFLIRDHRRTNKLQKLTTHLPMPFEVPNDVAERSDDANHGADNEG